MGGPEWQGSDSDVRDVWEMRILFEGWAARKSALSQYRDDRREPW